MEDCLPQGQEVVVGEVQVDEAGQVAQQAAHLSQVVVGQLKCSQPAVVAKKSAGKAH